MTFTDAGLSPTDQVKAKRREIEGQEGALQALREDRQRAAVDGSDTRRLREEIRDAEAELEDSRTQLKALEEAACQAEERELNRKRHAAVATIYNDDLSFLRARADLLRARGAAAAAAVRLQRAVDEMGERRTGQPQEGLAVGEYWRLRDMGREIGSLGVLGDPQVSVRAVSLAGSGNDGGDSLIEVLAEIERIEGLAAEAERAASGEEVTMTEEGSNE
jgi:hypothetical protein